MTDVRDQVPHHIHMRCVSYAGLLLNLVWGQSDVVTQAWYAPETAIQIQVDTQCVNGCRLTLIVPNSLGQSGVDIQ